MVNEQTIIEYIQRGYSNKYICMLLDVSPDHVEHYRILLRNEAKSYIMYE